MRRARPLSAASGVQPNVHVVVLRHLSSWSRAIPLPVALCLALGAATGCVRFYQPMSGLHRPVVVNPQLPNFQDVRLTVRCVPEDLLNAEEANRLCEKVGTLFENQGAEVTTIASARGAPGDELDGPHPPEDGGAERTTDLTLELRARRVHRSNHPVSWVLFVGSFTALPGVLESTYAQDVIVRDETGSLLASESLEGRIVEHVGLGSWAGNTLLDLVARDEQDKLTGDAFDRVVSADLYRQLSQILFNAKMRWQVLQQAPSGRVD
jgi:hypothetical protein